MIVFPAVDIKDGKCVRLKQGRADEVTLFSEDPVEMALHWESLGAKWLHIVDLDGAFEGRPKNLKVIEAICKKVNVPVQVGGGIRSVETAKALIEAGVQRIIVGTVAIENKELLKELCDRFAGRVGVSLDVSDRKVKIKGWVEDSGLYVEDVIKDLEKAGVSFVVYTDILRDGMKTGVNLKAIEEVLNLVSFPLIAAGGVKDLEDLKRLYPLSSKGLEGVIVGRALYEGTFDFKKAIDWLKKQS